MEDTTLLVDTITKGIREKKGSDIVIANLGVCVAAYQTCNGIQFKSMPASDFINFLNLKLAAKQVYALPREKQRICYMVYAVSQTIEPDNFARHWIEGILTSCDISLEYYDKHHKDVLSVVASAKNKEYLKLITEAIRLGQ